VEENLPELHIPMQSSGFYFYFIVLERLFIPSSLHKQCSQYTRPLLIHRIAVADIVVVVTEIEELHATYDFYVHLFLSYFSFLAIFGGGITSSRRLTRESESECVSSP